MIYMKLEMFALELVDYLEIGKYVFTEILEH